MGYRSYDTILLAPAIVALVSLGVLYMSDKHILPQTSTTFSMKAVRTYEQGDKDDAIFDTKTAFEGHKFYTTGKMQAVTATKYTRGCYGSVGLSEFDANITAYATVSGVTTGAREWDYFNTLNGYQRGSGGNNGASVCRCIDEYADRAFNIAKTHHVAAHTGIVAVEGAAAAGVAKVKAGVNLAEMVWRKDYWAEVAAGTTPITKRADGTLTAYKTFFKAGQPYETFPGNYEYVVQTTEYTHLAEIAEWCDQTALPQYTLEFQSVIYSKELLLVGLALVLAGLDVLGQRSGEATEGEDTGSLQNMVVFVLEVLPVWLLAGSFVYYQFTGHIKDSAADDQTNNTTYLMVVIYILIFVAASVLLIISISNAFADKTAASKVPQKMTQRIYTDVPMIAGLALVGVALKLQNGEHDEVILLTTLVVLVSAGLVQHLSNLVRIMYEKVCGLLSNEVIVALQSADNETVASSGKDHLDKTRRIMQYFGWTRLYGFGVVLVLVLVTVTMSSSVVATNPIQAFTQNQYYYFAFAFIVAWTGLDFIYEILPFTSNSVEDYSEQSVDRMRKVSVLFYVVFVLISQYTLEAGEF